MPQENNSEVNSTTNITLTLDSESVRPDMSFMEPRYGEVDEFSGFTTVSAGATDESMLSDAEKKQVEEFVKQIDISKIQTLNSYGAAAQKGISSFSTALTKTVRTKEFGELGDSLRELRVAINSTTVPEKKGILGLFKKGKERVTYLIANYQSAETNIQKIEKDIKQHQIVLTEDVFRYEKMYDMNMQFFKELTMYIIAGKKALDIARKTKLAELQEKADRTQDNLDVQAYRDYSDACNRFEKRIADLEITRTVSLQTAPQIRLLQNADQELIEKLRSDIINTIPLWRNQMVLALGIEHTTRALNAQSAVDEMTNEMLRRNAETLRQGAIEAAKASERGIVDIETLRQVNSDIIASINEVVKIHEDGAKKRLEAQEEMAKIEDELKTALLEAGRR